MASAGPYYANHYFAAQSRQITSHASTSSLYRKDALPDAKPTASKHWRQFLSPVYTIQPVVKPVWMFVYTIQPVVKPVVQPVWQPAVSCKRGFRSRRTKLNSILSFLTVDKTRQDTPSRKSGYVSVAFRGLPPTVCRSLQNLPSPVAAAAAAVADVLLVVDRRTVMTMMMMMMMIITRRSRVDDEWRLDVRRIGVKSNQLGRLSTPRFLPIRTVKTIDENNVPPKIKKR